MYSNRRASEDGARPAMASPSAPSPSMHRHTSSETGDIMSRRSSIAPSFSSDRPSVAGSVTFQMPTTVRPAPAYIAASVASQTVTDNLNAQLREAELDFGELENAFFSEQALALADRTVRIPLHGRAESLNLATAAAICLYASARAQRG